MMMAHAGKEGGRRRTLALVPSSSWDRHQVPHGVIFAVRGLAELRESSARPGLSDAKSG
jgi:hypothetical protein